MLREWQKEGITAAPIVFVRTGLRSANSKRMRPGAVQQLYYDVKVLFDACELLAEGDPEKIAGERAIYDALCLLDLRDTESAAFRNSVELADKSLRENYYDSRKEAPVTVHSIGYTHIDVAWKWPIRQTRQKAVRSYQTVLNLMKEYPEYRFSASTPELYEFVREDAPDLFEEIRKKTQEGRMPPSGSRGTESGKSRFPFPMRPLRAEHCGLFYEQ